MSLSAYRTAPLAVFIAAFALSFLFSNTISPALAQDSEFTWSFSEDNDASNRGRMTARLGYGVPETDNAQVDGVCDARGGPANLILGADIGKLEEGSDVTVRFSGGGFEHTVAGIVFGTKIEEGITGVSLDIDVRDKLWRALTKQAQIDYQVPGYSSSRLKLKDGHSKIRQFIRACRDYAESSGASASSDKTPETQKTAEAKPQPKKDEPKPAPTGEDAKEAFNSAKELGTIEGWEAFLESYPDGFRASLARAYLKRLGGSAGKKASAPVEPGLSSGQAAATPQAPPAPADIALAVTAQGACTGGQPCSINVTATNGGGEAFTGELVLATSIAPGKATVSSTSPQPWFCQDMGGGAVCTNPSVNLAPGESTSVLVALNLPRNTGGQITSCTSISWGGAPTASDARSVQQALNDAGFDAGPADGKPGRKTRNAIRAYQEQNGLQITGEIDLPLLLALFTQPGLGDGDPINDQACAGSAVASAVPLPPPAPAGPACPPGQVVNASGQCACPSSVPVWTGKSCLPRITRNCKGGTYYNKRQKLCLCPSRKPFWDGRRCQATAPLVTQPGLAGCPTGTVAVGNVCLNQNVAPLFANRGARRPLCAVGSPVDPATCRCPRTTFFNPRAGECVPTQGVPQSGIQSAGTGGGQQTTTGGGGRRPGGQTGQGGRQQTTGSQTASGGVCPFNKPAGLDCKCPANTYAQLEGFSKRCIPTGQKRNKGATTQVLEGACGIGEPVKNCKCPPGAKIHAQSKTCQGGNYKGKFSKTTKFIEFCTGSAKKVGNRCVCPAGQILLDSVSYDVDATTRAKQMSCIPPARIKAFQAQQQAGGGRQAGSQTASGGKACYPDPVTGKRVCNCPKAKIIRDPASGFTFCGSVQDAQKAIQAAQAKLKNNGCPKAKPVKTKAGQCISLAQARQTKCVDLGFPEFGAYHPTPSCAPSTGGGQQRTGSQTVSGRTCPLNQLMANNNWCTCPANTETRVEYTSGGKIGFRCVTLGTPPPKGQGNKQYRTACKPPAFSIFNGIDCGCPAGLVKTTLAPTETANLLTINNTCVPDPNKKSSAQKAQGSSGSKKCINNLVLQPNGRCGCPANLPRLLGNKCVAGLPNLLQQQVKKPASQADCKGKTVFHRGQCRTYTQGDCKPGTGRISGDSEGCLPVPGGAGRQQPAQQRTKAAPKKPAINCQPPARGIGGKCLCPKGQRVFETGRSGDGKTTFVINYGCAKQAPAPAQQKAATQKPLPFCNPGRLYQQGQCRCAKGWTWTRKPGANGFQCVKGPQAGQQKAAKDPFDCGDGRRKDNPTGRCLCPGGQSFVAGKCVRPQPANTRGNQPCKPGFARSPNNVNVCLPLATVQQLQRQKQQRAQQKQQQASQCVNNEIRLANGQCGCPANLPRHLERRCYPALKPQPAQQKQTGCPPTHNKVGNRCVLKPPPKKVSNCPSNMISLPNGQCGCPNWAQLRNGQCVRKAAPTLKTIKCAPNQIYNGQRCVTCGPNQVKQGNACVNKAQQQQVRCGPNQVKQGNRCVPKPKPQPAKCPNNQAKLPNGKCGCGNWANLVNGFCVRKAAPTLKTQCPPGTKWSGSLCAPINKPKALKCGPNQIQRNNQCQNCPPNTAKQGNQCIPRRVNCGPNQVQRGNACQNCPANTQKQGNQCVPRPSQQQLLQKQLQLRQQLQQQRPPQQQQRPPQQQGGCPPGLQPGPNGGCFRISDARLKRDIELVASRADGLKLYAFRYLWDDTAYVGVMAQDLLGDPARAHAVSRHESGYYMVDYTMLGVRMMPLDVWRRAEFGPTR